MSPDTSTNSFAAAIAWLQSTLLGTIATTIAVIAIACLGLLAMSGRIDLRRGAQVVIGCFILFGAPTIAAGIMHVLGPDAPPLISQSSPPPPPPLYKSPRPQPRSSSSPYDPYAGAALSPR